MRKHLSGALKRKSPLAWTWAAEAKAVHGETEHEEPAAEGTIGDMTGADLRGRR